MTVIGANASPAVKVAKGENFGLWTLMAVIEEPEGILAVFEELRDRRGSIIYVGKRGPVLNLPKSLEPTSAAARHPLSRPDSRKKSPNRKTTSLARNSLRHR